ncbi:hypothetical protein DQP56_10895 [Mycolicibacter senuensis]|nr:hypothetical protein DQP56_10895 [Mycolicibacter senuensis]
MRCAAPGAAAPPPAAKRCGLCSARRIGCSCTRPRGVPRVASASAGRPAGQLRRVSALFNTILINLGRYVGHKDLRRGVIFGHNDLVKDAPISRVDLLVYRSTLMYMNAETQRNK